MMDKTYLISVEECCTQYNIEIAFIDSLEMHGLLQPTVVENNRYYEHDNLSQLEKLIHMHYDMDINMEGMEVITRLLSRIETMQDEIRRLKGFG